MKTRIMNSFDENNRRGAAHLVAMSSLVKFLDTELLQQEIPSVCFTQNIIF